MKISENLSKIQELLQSCASDSDKFEQKSNFQASIRLRNNLSAIRNLCTETRELIIESRTK